MSVECGMGGLDVGTNVSLVSGGQYPELQLAAERGAANNQPLKAAARGCDFFSGKCVR